MKALYDVFLIISKPTLKGQGEDIRGGTCPTPEANIIDTMTRCLYSGADTEADRSIDGGLSCSEHLGLSWKLRCKSARPGRSN